MSSVTAGEAVIVGLVGLRCCGKSTVRGILRGMGYPVFDTNSVRTGDADANSISLDEVLARYGGNESYLRFLELHLKRFVSGQRGLAFVDSLKVEQDLTVIKEILAGDPVELWYLHAASEVRQLRYEARDITTNVRSQTLEEHDAALEKRGIWDLVKHANYVLNMEDDLAEIAKQVREGIDRIGRRYPYTVGARHSK